MKRRKATHTFGSSPKPYIMCCTVASNQINGQIKTKHINLFKQKAEIIIIKKTLLYSQSF